MHSQLSPRDRYAAAAIALLALTGLAYGWSRFWFLTDDAFISFRYISNSVAGYGYVWNAPPFRPVEGYTSFLWVFLLDLVWRISGVMPPASANPIALIFAMANLLLCLLMLLRVAQGRLRAVALPLAALALIGLITNRTFLAWTSSGLETAMFNFFITLWVYVTLCLPYHSPRWAFGISAAAALTALTRPDGLLLVAVSGGLLGLSLIVTWRTLRPWYLAWAFPLLVVPAHLLWRHAFYSEWLPNTYFAKSKTEVDRAQSGSYYLLSFIIEYGLWLWLALALVTAAVLLMRARRELRTSFALLASAAVTSAMLFHLFYYTRLIGGDHFEFRVYSHLVPLIFISFVWMLSNLRLRPALALGLLGLFVLLSWPVQWTHWAASQRYTTRAETKFLEIAVADEFARLAPATPEPILSYLRWYDAMQFWLIDHAVGMRHQEHKIFHFDQIASYNPRGLPPPPPTGPGIPLMKFSSVGVVSWNHPWLNIIDTVGLNDYVVARNPDLSGVNLMAHERQPPPGYIDCFTPEFWVRSQEILYIPPERVISCENEFWAKARAGNRE